MGKNRRKNKRAGQKTSSRGRGIKTFEITDEIVKRGAGGIPIAGFLKRDNFYGAIAGVTLGLGGAAGGVVVQGAMGQAIDPSVAHDASVAVAWAVAGYTAIRLQVWRAVAEDALKRKMPLTPRDRAVVVFLRNIHQNTASSSGIFC